MVFYLKAYLCIGKKYCFHKFYLNTPFMANVKISRAVQRSQVLQGERLIGKNRGSASATFCCEPNFRNYLYINYILQRFPRSSAHRSTSA